MSHIRRQFIDVPYGQMHLRIAEPVNPSGKRPLLCLHQSPKSSREFIAFMEVACQDRRIIAIDTPGHGESDIPDKADATIMGYAKALWDAVDGLDLGKVDMFGHHTGAKVATEMAYQRPRDVAGIVMVSALVLTPEERAEFADQFKPIPLDEAGTRFKHIWSQAIKYRGNGVSLVQLAASTAENIRAGEAYEWGHEAAFAYSEIFPDRVASLPHRITVLNPKDMLYDLTPRVAPLLRNGEVINHTEWGFGFMDTDTEGAAHAVKSALDN